MTTDLLYKGRGPCPKCHRKGLGFSSHAHALGYKDYTKATCRYCRARFRLRDKESQKLSTHYPTDGTQGKKEVRG